MNILPSAGRWLAGAMIALAVCPGFAQAKTSVWKVTAPDGKVLYLGGTVHRLRSKDYPLPAAYNRAFELSQRLAFEVSPDKLSTSPERWEKAGLYPAGDELRRHVDPRTYDYVAKVFGRMGVPVAKLNRCRPWFLVYLLASSGGGGGPGVEDYFTARAQQNSRKVDSLETVEEAMQTFSGLSERQSEALLLVTFIQAKGGEQKIGSDTVYAAWRNGDADQCARAIHAEYRDFPAMADRLLNLRNRAWIPKVESWIRSGQTYFVLAGAAHFGGSDGLLALLRARGYQIEQW